MDLPEPEPDCTILYNIEPFDYFILFFGAGVGWFVMGYLLSDCCYYRADRPNQTPILAESIN